MKSKIIKNIHNNIVGFSSLLIAIVHIFTFDFVKGEISDIRYRGLYFKESGIVTLVNKGDYPVSINISFLFLNNHQRICEIGHREIPKSIKYTKLSSFLLKAGGNNFLGDILKKENLSKSLIMNLEDYKYIIRRLNKFFASEMKMPLLEYESIVNDIFKFLLTKKLQKLLEINLTMPPEAEITNAVDCFLVHSDQQIENPFLNNPFLFSLFPKSKHEDVRSEIVDLCNKFKILVRELEKKMLDIWEEETGTNIKANQEGIEIVFFPLYQTNRIEISYTMRRNTFKPFTIYFSLGKNKYNSLRYEFAEPCSFFFKVCSDDPNINLRDFNQRNLYDNNNILESLSFYLENKPILYYFPGGLVLFTIISITVFIRYRTLSDHEILTKLKTPLGNHPEFLKKFYRNFGYIISNYIREKILDLNLPIEKEGREKHAQDCIIFIRSQIIKDPHDPPPDDKIEYYLKALVIEYIYKYITDNQKKDIKTHEKKE